MDSGFFGSSSDGTFFTGQGGATSAPCFLGQFSGDPYPEEPVTRSINVDGLMEQLIGHGPAGKSGEGKFGFGDPRAGCGSFMDDDGVIDCTGDFDFTIEDKPPGPPDVLQGLLRPGAPRPGLLKDLFAPGERAPRLASQPFRELGATTIAVQSTDPVSVGNALQRAIAQCCGVVPEKSKGCFGLRASMASGELPCSLEALIFEVTPQQFAVEMRRLSGDAVLFVSVFRKLRELLQDNGFTTCPLA